MFLLVKGSGDYLEVLHHATSRKFKMFEEKEEAERHAEQLNEEMRDQNLWRVVREEEIYNQ
ncbi:hypothetical protein [Salimicrobium halophilum]|uniref:Uncharacterized protein n=1 Tax=Salimicrobium halophilum TaxID=86666 RepID=A0A1G8UV31_9BACI|nr:hypothetical protein [Salimicrobium halophilum]SDJ57716.1 hypothetical protein SAMN04490247_2421 [Salimicrobium halophilum]